ncbi:MAG: molecular chaperone DjiA [Paracoccaceae bacterium]|nr:molecular chaperone DjiA [Paracoccaceae bacterium]MDG2256940.1 molecular chaperone DjiA [Paracoccaceae bacterium]
MSIWTRISEAIEALRRGDPLSSIFEALKAPPERSIAFTIAVIGLGAKIAKADGLVTKDEVTAFREVFVIAREDEASAARVYNLARQDVAGYEVYARRIAAMFQEQPSVLCDLMEGLYHVALADGTYHPNEDDFLEKVSNIFGISDARFRQLRARFVPEAELDPYTVLGVSPDQSLKEIRVAWKTAVRESHPDIMIARGVPEEAAKIAEKRMVDINRAWEEIQGVHV